MTTTTTSSHDQQPATSNQSTQIFAQWGLLRDITPRFGARLIQIRYRLDFLSDRANLIGEWSEEAIGKLNQAFPAIIKVLETKLLTGELDACRQQCITLQHGGFTCEADTLGSHGYVYVAIHSTHGVNVTPDVKNSQR